MFTTTGLNDLEFTFLDNRQAIQKHISIVATVRSVNIAHSSKTGQVLLNLELTFDGENLKKFEKVSDDAADRFAIHENRLENYESFSKVVLPKELVDDYMQRQPVVVADVRTALRFELEDGVWSYSLNVSLPIG